MTTNLLNRIAHRITQPFSISMKTLSYRSDANYVANHDIKKCFEDRFANEIDDTNLLRRIVCAYQKASADILNYAEIFRPSNEWLPIYENNLREVMSALKTNNIEELNKIYRNYWREPCSRGLVGLPLDMKKSYYSGNHRISYINKSLYLNDSIHRFNLWEKLLGKRFSEDCLISPTIGNPYGYFVNEKFIKSGADYQHYYATRIIDLLPKNDLKTTVAEIGAGFGGMAYYLIRDSKKTTYVDFDLPENLALTSYYLMKCFPEKSFLLYGEGDFSNASLQEFDIILMPSFQIDKAPPKRFDVVFNSYSLAEMSSEAIDHYIKRSSELINSQGWFYHVNHTKHSLVSALEFSIPKNLIFVESTMAEWNFGRNSNMDEYEFLYRKT